MSRDVTTHDPRRIASHGVTGAPAGTARRADVVVVGARCAGASTAMLLAEAGLDVVVLDDSTDRSEPMSTLMIQPEGMELLDRWGLGEAVAALAAPPLTRVVHQLDDVVVDGRITPRGSYALAPRRPALDDVLAAGARRAGATVLRRTRVTSVQWRDGKVTGVEARLPDGESATFTADLVVGADGVRSTVAAQVGAEPIVDGGSLTCAYYAFLPAVDAAVRLYETEGRLVTHIPTSGGDAVVAVYRPGEQFADVRQDPRRHFLAALSDIRGLEHLAERDIADLPGFTGTGQQPNYLRHAAGPGWMLVGDAAHCRDSVTAWGISQAFRQAAGVAEIVADELGGTILVDALENFWTVERERLAGPYRATLKLASLQGGDDGRRAFLRAVVAAGRQDEYVRALASGSAHELLDSVLEPGLLRGRS